MPCALWLAVCGFGRHFFDKLLKFSAARSTTQRILSPLAAAAHKPDTLPATRYPLLFTPEP
jgi:hypothetical protein